MRSLIIALAFVATALPCGAQEFFKKFKELVAAKDTMSQRRLLQNWEVQAPKDPELFVAYFNYYVQKSMSEVMALEPEPRNESALAITDSSGKLKGYMNSFFQYDPMMLARAYSWVDKGIALFPNRLDMRFGKVFMLGETKQYTAFTGEIIQVVEHSVVIRNAWLWSNNIPQAEARDFMLTSIQEYQLQLYNTGRDEQLEQMKRIAENILKHYPKHVESLSNIAAVYLVKGQHNKAIDLLLQARAIAPQDAIVLNNIAEAYKRKGDKKKAAEYYAQVLKYGDEEIKAYAKQQLDEFQKAEGKK